MRFALSHQGRAVAISVVLYFVIASVFYAVLVWIPGTVYSVKNVVKMLGISGDAVAIVLLALTALLEGYDKEKYITRFRTPLKHLFPRWSDFDIDRRLGTWHAKLRNRTSKILKVGVGASIAAIGVIVGFIADFV